MTSACEMSISRIWACGCGLRTVCPQSIPASTRSLAYANSPVAFGLRREHEARADQLPVEKDGAGAALALLAGVLRAGEPEALAQGEEEALALPDVGLHLLAVDREREFHAASRQRSMARAVRT